MKAIKKALEKIIFAFRYFYHSFFSGFGYLGSRVLFREGVTIENAEYISLGDRVYLDKNVTLRFLEDFVDRYSKKPRLIIEKDTIVSSGTVIAAAKYIHIKEKVLIGPHCFIGDHDHEYGNADIPIKEQGYKNIKDIVIEDGAWIASNVTVCSGVTIGKNSVIGANSVVVNDVPPFSLAVGAPARVVKKFNQQTRIWDEITHLYPCETNGNGGAKLKNMYYPERETMLGI